MINDLYNKQEKISNLHCEIFEEDFWSRFKDRQGRPISYSVLGIGTLDMSQLHPLVVVINNRLEDLWKTDDIINDLKENPEESVTH